MTTPYQAILAERVRLLPLAITRVDEVHACVGAVREDGGWVRPEPVHVSDLRGGAPIYQYFRWSRSALGPATGLESRPEDRALLERPEGEGEVLPEEDRLTLLERRQDRAVSEALMEDRSLGLVEAYVQRLYLKRSTGGRRFLRMEFIDPSGEIFDWIVPDMALNDALEPFVVGDELHPPAVEAMKEVFRCAKTFVTLGLTLPNNRFPGRFRGCHPLIVGVHTVPHWSRSLALLPRAT